MVSVTESVRPPDGIRGRKGEVLSRDPRGGEEVKAFDAIDSKPPLASRQAVPKSIIRNVFKSIAVKSRA